MRLLRGLLMGLLYSLIWRMIWSRWGMLMIMLFGGLSAYTDIPSRLMGELALARPAQEIYVASVARIVDGDTLDVRPLSGWSPFARRLRLAGIDTPEKFGKTACPQRAAQASQALFDALVPSEFMVEVRIQERIGKRWLADVRRMDGRSLSSLMLANGQARSYFPGASKTPWRNCH